MPIFMQADSVIFQMSGYDGGLMPAGRPAKHARTAFGQRLHDARLQAGLSQIQIAESLSITQPSYADWERRSVALKPEYLPKLADLLGVSVEYLVGTQPAKTASSAPAGRARRVFDAVLKLPRKQQAKVIEMAEGFLALHQKTGS
jgi:transcriptional regulator with XRE-family HTH domain